MQINTSLSSRLLRDMHDGVIGISNKTGKIEFINRHAMEVLGYKKEITGLTFADFMIKNQDSRNDEFYQLILDSIYDKKNLHSKEIAYYYGNRKRILNITTSFLFSDDGNEKLGIIVIFSDITESVALRKKVFFASFLFTILISYLCLLTLSIKFLEENSLITNRDHITLAVEISSFLMISLLLKFTDLKFSDIGIRPINMRSTIIHSSVIIILFTLILVTVKALILIIFPDIFPTDMPFFDTRNFFSLTTLAYVFTAFIQEFIARGLVQSSLRIVFSGKYGTLITILVSSLIFAAVHMFYSFSFMMLAGAMVGILGIQFEKQKNIWGVTMVHFFLGTIGMRLFFTGI